ncbi:hypothetical protein DFH27DRAFT_314396 [Peziza echinospora]|nr:hypothetical protein DFH27DRAFT_314396 [Peziza echinospora]
MKTKISAMSKSIVYQNTTTTTTSNTITGSSTISVIQNRGRRDSFDSLRSYDSRDTQYSQSRKNKHCSNIQHSANNIIKSISSSSTSSSSSSSSSSMMKSSSRGSTALGLRNPFERRSACGSTSVETMRSVPSSSGSSGKSSSSSSSSSSSGAESAKANSSSNSMANNTKTFFTKVPKLFEHKFELPFTGHGNHSTTAVKMSTTTTTTTVSSSNHYGSSSVNLNRQSRISPIMLSRRSRKPSMLDFSCIGTGEMGCGSMVPMPLPVSPVAVQTPLPMKRATVGSVSVSASNSISSRFSRSLSSRDTRVESNTTTTAATTTTIKRRPVPNTVNRESTINCEYTC